MIQHLTAILLAATAGVAQAQAYVSAAAGVGRDNTKLDPMGILHSDTTGTAYKLVGGYGVGHNLAVELAYISFGKASVDGGFRGESKSDGIGLDLAYRLPLNPSWDFTVRGGLLRMKTRFSGIRTSLYGYTSAPSTAPHLGLAAGYSVSPRLRLDAHLDFSRNKYSHMGSGERSNVRAYTAGATFMF